MSSIHASLFSVHQKSDKSYCVKLYLLECHPDRIEIAVFQGLDFGSRDSLSVLEPSDPGPMYVQKIGLAHCLPHRRTILISSLEKKKT